MAIPVYVPPPSVWGVEGAPQDPAPSPPPPGTHLYPSNADILSLGKIEASEESSFIGKWWPLNQLQAGIYNTPAPKGHYILDPFVLDRASVSGIAISSDEIDERPSSVGFFAGRVWWSGIDNDKYVGTLFFSQLLDSDSKIGKCYQDADPTSDNISDLVDTDGGVIPIPEAGRILKLIPFNESLICFADNGVWAVGGEGGFVATSYFVRKITNIGVLSANSVVEAENFIFFWSDSGIYRLAPDNITGFLSPQNLSISTIQRFYNELPAIAKFRVFGIYDNTEKRIWWYYNPNPTWTGDYGGEGSYPGNYIARYTHALVFDLTLEAFAPQKFGEDGIAYVVGAAMSGSNTRQNETLNVIIGDGDNVIITPGDNVVVSSLGAVAAQQQQQVMVALLDSQAWDFGTYTGDTFLDFDIWDPKSYSSYLETGYDIQGNISSETQATWVLPAFKRTEKSYTVTSSVGAWNNQSDCRLRGKWDWTSTNSGKWSFNEVAYRLIEPYEFTDVDGTYTYNGGQEVVKTKLKVRGQGTAVQLRFESTEGKDLHIYGWELVLEGTNIA